MGGKGIPWAVSCMEGVFVRHAGTLHYHRWDHLPTGKEKEVKLAVVDNDRELSFIQKKTSLLCSQV